MIFRVWSVTSALSHICDARNWPDQTEFIHLRTKLLQSTMSASSESVAKYVPIEALTNMQAKDELIRDYIKEDKQIIKELKEANLRFERNKKMAYFVAEHTNVEVKKFATIYHPYPNLKSNADMQKCLLDDSSDEFYDVNGNTFYLVDKIIEFERNARKSAIEDKANKRKASDAANTADATHNASAMESNPYTMGARPNPYMTMPRPGISTGKRARH